jgi:hypothetical protein
MAADGQEHSLKTNDPTLQFVSHGYSGTADRAQGLTFVINDAQRLAFKLNRQDGLNLIASEEVRDNHPA